MTQRYGKSFSQFRRDKLARPGTVIVLANGEQYLIGDINMLGGVCDDCPAFSMAAIVETYTRVWQKEK